MQLNHNFTKYIFRSNNFSETFINKMIALSSSKFYLTNDFTERSFIPIPRSLKFCEPSLSIRFSFKLQFTDCQADMLDAQ